MADKKNTGLYDHGIYQNAYETASGLFGNKIADKSALLSYLQEEEPADDMAQIEKGEPVKPTPDQPPETQAPTVPKSEEVGPEEEKPAEPDRAKSLADQYLNDVESFNEEAKSLDQQMMDEIAEAKAAYKVAKDQESSKQLWEAIIQGVGHIAAGIIGNQTGTNLSGLQFNKQDWDARRRSIQNELQSAKEDAYRRMSGEQRRLTEKRAQRRTEYGIRADEIDRAYKKEKDIEDRKLRAEQHKAKVLKELDKQKANVAEDKKKELDKYIAETGKFMKQYTTKKNADTLAAIESNAKIANSVAERNGLPKPFPEGFAEDPPGWLDTPSAEDLYKQQADYRVQLNASGPTTEKPGAKIKRRRDKNGRIVLFDMSGPEPKFVGYE